MILRPAGTAGGFLLPLLMGCLEGCPAAAAQGFHLFAETAPPPPAGVRLQLAGLPPSSPLGADAGAFSPSASAASSPPPSASLPPYPTEKRFAAAALETLALDVVPWLINRYGAKSFFAEISLDTTVHNLQTGFTYDHDPFPTNQASHPFHGSAYFNAARTNGYSFWESAPFALGGSWLWEMFSESQPPALNDLVQTTLGGMAWGEAQYRVANMVLDNTASGLNRFLREAAGLFINPMGAFNRILRGEMWKDLQNPPDRFPGRFYVELDGGYLERSCAAPNGGDMSQGVFTGLLRYGDPFNGELEHPFDVFDASVSLAQPAPVLLTAVAVNGILDEWTLSSSRSAEQRLALLLAADYVNNEPQVYGAQSFGAAHLLRVPLGRGTDLRTGVSVEGIPLAAIGVDHHNEGMASPIGRTYDYGPGLGARASARLRRREVDLVALSWSLLGTITSNGISNGSRAQTVSATARLPLTSRLLLGGGWSWSERLTTYREVPTTHATLTSWQVFAGWSLPETYARPMQPSGAEVGSEAPSEARRRWTLSAFAGGFFGTRVFTGPETSVLMIDAPLWGLRAGYDLTRVFSLEASWSHSSTRLQPIETATRAPAGPFTSATVNSYELEGLFGFGGKAVRGYVGLGAGVQDIHPSIPTLDATGATARFAANIALGGLYYFTPAVAFRVDGRYRWRAGDERVGTYGCEPEPIGCKPFTTDVFSSGEVTGGLTFRF